MAKLPSDEDLGPLQPAASGRTISSYDTTGYAKGAAALGQGVQNLGEGFTKAGKDFAAVAKSDRAKEDVLEETTAMANFNVGKINYMNAIKDDRDHTTLAERSQADLTMLGDGAANGITDPRRREMFKAKIADDIARSQAAVNDHVFKKEGDEWRANATSQLDSARQAALFATDEAEKAKAIQAAQALIAVGELKGYYTKEQAQQATKQWAENYAIADINMKPPEERVAILRSGGTFDGALRHRESTNDPTKVNPYGYAGYYQFGAPRLATLGVYTPGAAERAAIKDGSWSRTSATAPGKWSGEFSIPGFPDVKTLDDFRKNPDAQVAAYGIHKKAMDTEISANGFDRYIGKTVGGVPITKDGLYGMLHLGGVKGTARALESGGTDVVRDANGTSVLDYARMGARKYAATSLIPADKVVTMERQADLEVTKNQNIASVQRGEAYETQILNAKAGIGDLPSREAIQNDKTLTEVHRNVALRQYDAAAGDVAAYARLYAKFKDPNGGAFNVYDSEDKKGVDTLYTAFGGTPEALQAVVDRTGTLPKTAAVSLRGDMISNDPKKVASALTLSSNLLAKNANIFVGVDGKSDLENNAVAFRHYVDDLGMTADDAAKKIIFQQSSEYQASVKVKLKNEDIDGKIKKDLSINDLAGAFDQVPWVPFTDPKVGFDPGQRSAMYQQYAEQVKERYLDHGDWGRAKKEAAAALGKSWGVSRVNGSAVVTQYPPERAPVMAGVENPAEVVAKQAITAIQETAGYAPERKTLQFIPVPGVTPAAFKNGQPVPYILKWEDKNGITQILNPGKAFTVDVAGAKNAQVQERQTKFEKGAQAAAINAEFADQTPAPLRNYGFQ